MINFHYLGNASYDIQKLKNLSNILDQHGYESILLTYKSNVDDRWIQVANIINPLHKLKYTIALRTYAISPEYVSIIYNAFQSIDKDKIQFNIISGEIANDENILNGTIEIHDLIDTSEKRIQYTKKWIESFLSLKTLKSKPFIWMSGKSNLTKEIANKNADLFIGVYSDYKITNDANPEDLYKITTKRKGLACGCLIRESLEEAQLEINKLIELNNGKAIGQTFYGTKNSVKNEILNFCSSYGITDLMVVEYESDKEFYRVHDMIKSIKNDGII